LRRMRRRPGSAAPGLNDVRPDFPGLERAFGNAMPRRMQTRIRASCPGPTAAPIPLATTSGPSVTGARAEAWIGLWQA